MASISKPTGKAAMLGMLLALSACATQQAPAPYVPVVAAPYQPPPVVPAGVMVPYGPPAVVYVPQPLPYDVDPFRDRPMFGAATLGAWSRGNIDRQLSYENQVRRQERRRLRQQRREAGAESQGDGTRRTRRR